MNNNSTSNLSIHIIIFCSLLFCSFTAFSQFDAVSIELYKNLNVSPLGSHPEISTVVDDKIIFLAEDECFGKEPHVWNSTTKEVFMLEDIEPGFRSPEINTFEKVGNHIVFLSHSSYLTDNDYSVWTTNSDLSKAERLVFDGSEYFDDRVSFIGTLNNFLILEVADSLGVTSFWKTDGTQAGTTNFYPEIANNTSSVPSSFLRIANEELLVFSRNNALWKTDGTLAGTKVLVENVNNANMFNAAYLQLIGRSLLYAKTFGIDNVFLWNLDDDTQVSVTSLLNYEARTLSVLPARDDHFYLDIIGVQDGERTIYQLDQLGQNLSIYINKGVLESFTFDFLGWFKDYLIVSKPRDLHLISDDEDIVIEDIAPQDFKVYGEDLYLTGDRIIAKYSGSGGKEILYDKRDVNEIRKSATIFFDEEEMYYLEQFNEQFRSKLDLFKLNTNGQSTFLDRISNASRFNNDANGVAIGFHKVSDHVFYTSYDSIFYGEPHYFSKDATGVNLIDDIYEGDEWYDIEKMEGVDNENFFGLILGDDFTSNGWDNPKGAFLLDDALDTTYLGFNDKNFVASENLLYYYNRGAIYYYESYEAPAKLLYEGINPRVNNSHPKMAFKDKFIVNTGYDGTWISNSSNDGLFLLTDRLNSLGKGSSINLEHNGLLYFIQFKDENEIWVTDGTPQGTKFIAELARQIEYAEPGHFFSVWNDKVIFPNFTTGVGYEAWVTDGTEAGTEVLFENLNDPPVYNAMFNLTPLNGHLYFHGFDNVYKYNPSIDSISVFNFRENVQYRNDNIENIFSTRNGIFIYTEERDKPNLIFLDNRDQFHYLDLEVDNYFVINNDFVFCSGLTDSLGFEPYVTAGTVESTEMVLDLFEGERSSDISFFQQLGEQVVFKGHHKNYGDELFVLDYKLSPRSEVFVYHDENQNGQYDNNESGVPNIKLKVEDSGKIYFSNLEGLIELPSEEVDGKKVNLCLDNCWMPIDSLERVIDLTQANPSIGIFKDENYMSTLTRIYSPITRCAFPIEFTVQVFNDGCADINGLVEVVLEKNVEFESSSSGFIQVQDTLSYTFSGLSSFNSETPTFIGVIADELFIGDTVSIVAKTFHDINGELTLHDSILYNHEITCAIDPNDKLVDPRISDPDNSNYIQKGEELFYTIRFQNVGTDTAFNVMIKDKLDSNLDQSTLQLLASSHDPSSITLEDDELVFYYRDINLPDSTTNEPKSHGFTSFMIKAKEDLEDFEVIDNTAEIYFDFNQPIITNTVESTFITTIDADGDNSYFWEDCDDTNPEVYPGATEIPNNGIDEDCDGSDLMTAIHTLAHSTISIYPNPAIDNINIDVSGSLEYRITLYDIEGRQMLSTSNQSSISISNLPNGIYLLEIKDLQSGQSIVERIIKG